MAYSFQGDQGMVAVEDHASMSTSRHYQNSITIHDISLARPYLILCLLLFLLRIVHDPERYMHFKFECLERGLCYLGLEPATILTHTATLSFDRL